MYTYGILLATKSLGLDILGQIEEVRVSTFQFLVVKKLFFYILGRKEAVRFSEKHTYCERSGHMTASMQKTVGTRSNTRSSHSESAEGQNSPLGPSSWQKER
jgi:hypothetical protein